jgi:F-type H+-transporting ATPase subunit b
MAFLTLAAEQAEVTFVGLIPFITALVVFLIVFAIAAKVIWPKILAGLDEREAKIRDEIRSAEEAREQAKGLLNEYEKNLAQARDEANQMIAKARNDAKAVAEELRSRNEAELVELKHRATLEIEAAKRNAINDIYLEATNLATTIASKILEREVSAQDQQRLVEESLGELAAANGSK